ncbi:sacsin N-terminal ATP-binding-like domain-containing protein [Vibrio harveyi]
MLNPTDVQRAINKKSLDEIEAYLSTRGKSRVYEGARNLSLNVSDDYGERFLVELIQNAHDAHGKSDKLGEIAVVFDPEESDFGCLYVANRGDGFASKNFEAITNIALSSKSVNEDIGNKGLGFRSVLQICESPEIYSSQHSGYSFDGYCFRFANEEDVLFLLADEYKHLANEIIENMPCLFLPIFQEARPGLIPYFSDLGFASVVRLPLSSKKSQESVVQQMQEVLDREEPLNLFFERIEKFSLEYKGRYNRILDHKVLDFWGVSEQVSISRVEVAGDIYLHAKRVFTKEEFEPELNASIELGELPSSWSNWKGQASIDVAVKLDDTNVDNGLLYCFLPLGSDGVSPFSGYINANFYTSMDRRTLNSDVGLNEFFIKTAANLCGTMIEFLVNQNWSESKHAVVKLLCWKYPYREAMLDTLTKGDLPLISGKLLPISCNSDDQEWCSIDSIRIFGKDNSCLTPAFLSFSASASILDEAFSEEQVNVIRNFFIGKHDFKPTSVELTEWIEAVAKNLLQSHASPTEWAHFYNEVAAAFDSFPEGLCGCRFLVNSKDQLVYASHQNEKNSKKQTKDVYFPPVRVNTNEDDAELDLTEFPVELQTSFTLLSKTVPWTLKDGGCRNARSFLIDAGLVKEYDKRELLRTLAKVTREQKDELVRYKALVWAFKLWGAGRALASKDTRSAGFNVPTQSGWIDADQAMFGLGWSDAINGVKLDQFFKRAKGQSTEIMDRFGNFLLPYEQLNLETGTERDWFRFLEDVGVRDHLRLFFSERLSENATVAWLPTALANKLKQSDLAKNMWKSELEELSEKAWYNSVPYSARCDVWLIPGLMENSQLSEEVRKLYSYQLVKAINDIPSNRLRFRVSRKGTNIIELSSPLSTFLKLMPWMPVARRGAKPSFVSPQEAWFFNVDDEASPRFLTLIIPAISRFLEVGNISEFQRLLRFRGLADKQYVQDSVEYLLDTVENGLVGESDTKRFKSLFSILWQKLVASGVEEKGISRLVANVGERIEIVDFTLFADDQKCFYVDEDDPSKVSLLGNLEIPYFDFDRRFTDNSWSLIRTVSPSIKRLSCEDLYVIVDGEKIDTETEMFSLEECFGSEFLDLLVLIAAHKGQHFFSATKSPLVNLRAQARKLRIVISNQVEVSIAGKVSSLPSSSNGAVVTSMGDAKVLVIQTGEPNVSISILTAVSEQFAHALNYASLSNAFEATFLRLCQESWQLESGDKLSDLFEKLIGVPSDGLNNTLKEVRGSLELSLRLAAVLAGVHNNNQLVDELNQIVSDAEEVSDDEVIDILQPLANQLEITSRQLLDKLADTFDLRSLQEMFDISLLKLNTAVKYCDGFVKESNEKRHRQQFSSFLSENKGEIVDRLRKLYLNDFDSLCALDDYSALKQEIGEIEPSSNWFYVYDDLSDEVMESYLWNWLDERTSELAVADEELLPMDELREVNNKILREFWKDIGPVVSTWVHNTDEPVSEEIAGVWSDPVGSLSQSIINVGKEGWLDFRKLSFEKIAMWLSLYGYWPAGKEPVSDLSAWGINEHEIARKKELLRLEKEQLRKQRTVVMINSTEHSAEEEGYLDLYDTIKSTFSETTAFENAGKREAKLEEFDRHVNTKSGGRGTFASSNSATKMSNEQKAAIGLAGEAFAFEWIKRHHDKMKINNECWVSGYRNHIFADDNGDDSLGYDFIVKLKTVTYYYEVKATQGQNEAFEMGPTEVAAAQKFASDKYNKYRVLFVSNVSDPSHTQISLLPNPFSVDGTKVMRLVGSGSMKFSFHKKVPNK